MLYAELLAAEGDGIVRGRVVRKVWEYDPTAYAPARAKRACDYEAFIPDPLATLDLRMSGELATLVSDAEGSIRRLNADPQPALAPLARLLLRTESIASSKVEGMQVDARTLARAEAAHDTGRRVGSESLEILANIDAMQFAIELLAAQRRTRPEDYLEIHRELLARASNHHIAGHFRTRQNWIGGNDYNPCGAAFVPPPPEEVPALLDDLCAFSDEQTLPPLVHAAIAHAQFETIHPFDDGNGRTGRALIQVLLRRRGLAPSYVPPISIVFARDKERYIRGLEQYRADDLEGWLEIFASSAAEASELAARHVGRVRELQEDWRARLREGKAPRADAATWLIIDALPAHPIATLPILSAATGRTRPAVNSAIKELQDAGILIPTSGSTRNRAWEAEGLLDLIVGLESGSL